MLLPSFLICATLLTFFGMLWVWERYNRAELLRLILGKPSFSYALPSFQLLLKKIGCLKIEKNQIEVVDGYMGRVFTYRYSIFGLPIKGTQVVFIPFINSEKFPYSNLVKGL